MFMSVWQLPKFNDCNSGSDAGSRFGHSNGGWTKSSAEADGTGKSSGHGSNGATGSDGTHGGHGGSAGSDGTSGTSGTAPDGSGKGSDHGSKGTSGSGSNGTQGTGTSGTKGGSDGSGGTSGSSATSGASGSGPDCGNGSSGTSYHNGGVEGQGLNDWYDANLGCHFDGGQDDEGEGQGGTGGGTAGATGGTVGATGGTEGGAQAEDPVGPLPEDDLCEERVVLDLTEEGAIRVINLTEDPDTGTFSGSVEYLDDDGVPIALGHFEDVDDILMPDPSDPDGPDGEPRDIDFDVEGVNPAPLPPKADLTDLISSITACAEEEASAEAPEEDMTDACEIYI